MKLMLLVFAFLAGCYDVQDGETWHIKCYQYGSLIEERDYTSASQVYVQGQDTACVRYKVTQ